MINFDKNCESLSTLRLIINHQDAIKAIGTMFMVNAAEVIVDDLCNDNHSLYKTKESMDKRLNDVSLFALDSCKDFLLHFEESLIEFIKTAKVNKSISKLTYNRQGELDDVSVYIEVVKPSIQNQNHK
jgi:hypothetical protein